MHLTKRVATFLVVLVISGFICSFFSVKPDDVNERCHQLVITKTTAIIKSLYSAKQILDTASSKNLLPLLKSNYSKTRRQYKQLECYIEYMSPFDAKYFVNDPLVKKSELEFGKKVFDPHGFQVVEELLFSKDSLDKNVLKKEYDILVEVFQAFQKKDERFIIKHAQVLEMVQFEMVRIMSLTLNGYDATFTKTNINECSWALQGCIDILNCLKPSLPDSSQQDYINLTGLLHKAITYCKQHVNYDTFDRLYFITRYLNPVYKQLAVVHQSSGIAYTPVNYALNLKSDNFFSKTGFNINFFSVNVNDTLYRKQQAELGKLLFFDPILSGNNERACASCHKPELGFTDGLQKANGFNHDVALERNTPTLLNAMFQKNFFHDGRARQAEQQVNDVLQNQKEMNGSIEDAIQKLNQSEEYQSLFKLAFAGTADTTINYYGILKAIAEYEKTLTSFNSRFDQYLRGNYNKMTPQEIHGYTIFAGKALCGSCHFFPLFNGLVPPVYTDTEYEVIGVPDQKDSKQIDMDEGRKIVSKVDIHQYAFKTPTVRNIGITAPYMHNGIYKTLDEVLDFYNKGGGQGLGINIAHQTLPFDSLQLSKKEMQDIKAFMLSLTDTTGLSSRPSRLPHCKDDRLNKRVVGGVY